MRAVVFELREVAIDDVAAAVVGGIDGALDLRSRWVGM
jgi:hypothetical protein